MIARIWHGRTKIEDMDSYADFMKVPAIPDYKKTMGFINLSFLKQVKDNECHFTLITYWKNLDVIKNFAGSDYEKAKYYPEDEAFLIEFETCVQHHEVFATTLPV